MGHQHRIDRGAMTVVYAAEAMEQCNLLFDPRSSFDEQKLLPLTIEHSEACGIQHPTRAAGIGAAWLLTTEVRQATVLGDAENEELTARR